jgi:hypothetical protein
MTPEPDHRIATAASRKGLRWFAVAYVALGLVGLVTHLDVPIVRNSLLYARIAYAFVDHGTGFSAAAHGFHKALGFPILSLPFVLAFGANIGLKVASFFWTTLWVVSTVVLFRRLGHVLPGGRDGAPSLYLAFSIFVLSPLVYYQFLSAYPDSLNALMFLWALLFLDRTTARDCRWYDGLAFVATTLAAIWVKHHGLVLLAVAAVFVACRLDVLRWQWRERRRDLAISSAALALLLLVFGLAQIGLLPIFSQSHNVRNYTPELGQLATLVVRNLSMTTGFLLLSFSCLIPLLFVWREFRRSREWYVTLVVFVVSILLYRGATYNPRYFLPIAPLLAWIACCNLTRLSRTPRRLLVSLFVACQLCLGGYYNSNLGWRVGRSVYALPDVDNLRLNLGQRRARETIDAINANVRNRGDVLFFIRKYYGDGMWYVWERDGLLSDQLEVIYLQRPDWDEIVRLAEERRIESAILYVLRSELDASPAPANVRTRQVGFRVHRLTIGARR